MCRALRYSDRQIPISQIPLMAAFPRACDVQTVPNPPTEKSDAPTDKVSRKIGSITRGKFTERDASSLYCSLFYPFLVVDAPSSPRDFL